MPLSYSKRGHAFWADNIIPVFNQRHDCSDANRAQTPSCLISISILLIYFGDIYSSLQNLQDLEQLAERQMPAHHYLTVFYSLRRPARGLPLNSSLY